MRPRALTWTVELDDDEYHWSVHEPDGPDHDGRTVASGREDTYAEAEEAAAEALADIEHAADIRETERSLSRWIERGW